jgi:hypothetical protein
MVGVYRAQALALVVLCALPASAAEFGAPTQEAHKNGRTSRVVSFCQDTGANGSCDSGTLPPSGNWTKPMDCRGSRSISAHLGQGASVTGATTAAIYSCRTGYSSSASPAHASNAPYCSELTGIMPAGATSCASEDPVIYARVAGTDRCVILESFSDAGNETGGGPIYFADQRGCTDFVVSIEHAATDCITPNDIKVLESSSGTAALPTVHSTIGTLTGVIDPLVATINFGRTPKGALSTTHTASADAQCTEVHVTATLKCPNGPPDVLSDVVPDMSLTPDSSVQQLVALFACTGNCEAGFLDLTCLE